MSCVAPRFSAVSMFASENHAVRSSQFGHRTCLGWLLARDCRRHFKLAPKKSVAYGMNEAMRQTHILYTSNYRDTSLLQKTDLDKVVKELLIEISGR